MPVRLRIDCAYDGTSFSGWARQPGLATVEGALGVALATLTRDPDVRLTVAGRTDAGVHARGQVAHADVPVGSFTAAPGRSGRSPEDAFRSRLNAILARDLSARQPAVVVTRVSVAPPGFDARFSASWRRYRYRIADDAASRDPLARAHVVWREGHLDVATMGVAAASLLGEHDFLSFCKPRAGATTVRTLLEASVTRSGGLVVVELRADAFCHSMVRAIVGALLPVGEGRRGPEWVRQVLDERHHGHMVIAPARGLTLEEVGYPPDDELGTRAAMTRARRDQPSSSWASKTNSPESASKTNSPESSSRSTTSSSASSSPSSSTSELNSE